MGHYVKILCDEIFGREHFISDIVRIKCNPKILSAELMEILKTEFCFMQKAINMFGMKFMRKSQKMIYINDLKSKIKSFYTIIPLHAPTAK